MITLDDFALLVEDWHSRKVNYNSQLSHPRFHLMRSKDLAVGLMQHPLRSFFGHCIRGDIKRHINAEGDNLGRGLGNKSSDASSDAHHHERWTDRSIQVIEELEEHLACCLDFAKFW